MPSGSFIARCISSRTVFLLNESSCRPLNSHIRCIFSLHPVRHLSSVGRIVGPNLIYSRPPHRACSVENPGKVFLRPVGDIPSRISQPNCVLNTRAFLSTSADSGALPKHSVIHKKPGSDLPKPAKEQITNTQILQTLARYLWLKDNFEFRLRVGTALGFLVGAKVLNVQVPFLFKLAVDWLATTSGAAGALDSFTNVNTTALAIFATPAAVLVGYGIARAGASAFNELRNAVFSKVALRTIRSVSRKVFSHLHGLDLQFHLRTKTEPPKAAAIHCCSSC